MEILVYIGLGILFVISACGDQLIKLYELYLLKKQIKERDNV